VVAALVDRDPVDRCDPAVELSQRVVDAVVEAA